MFKIANSKIIKAIFLLFFQFIWPKQSQKGKEVNEMLKTIFLI